MLCDVGYRMAAECARNALLQKAMDNKQDPGFFLLEKFHFAICFLCLSVISMFQFVSESEKCFIGSFTFNLTFSHINSIFSCWSLIRRD